MMNKNSRSATVRVGGKTMILSKQERKDAGVSQKLVNTLMADAKTPAEKGFAIGQIKAQAKANNAAGDKLVRDNPLNTSNSRIDRVISDIENP